jgi:hypothetical protein
MLIQPATKSPIGLNQPGPPEAAVKRIRRKGQAAMSREVVASSERPDASSFCVIELDIQKGTHQHSREDSNPQPNPQNSMSYTTSANFGSPRGLVSCCKTKDRSVDTVEI